MIATMMAAATPTPTATYCHVGVGTPCVVNPTGELTEPIIDIPATVAPAKLALTL